MSVLLPKEDNNNSKVGNSLREKSQRQKSGQTTKQQNRDSLHLVNEKNATNLQATDHDEDSETENLSPLLYHKNNKKPQSKAHGGKKVANTSNGGAAVTATTAVAAGAATGTTQFPGQQTQSALHIDGVSESIDDTDTDLEERADTEVSHISRHHVSNAQYSFVSESSLQRKTIPISLHIE